MTSRYPGGLVRKNAANTAITGASGVWDLGSQAQAVKNNTWPISGLANPVSGSLRFRSSAQSYLNRTFGTPTNNKIWTYSVWIKRGSLAANRTIMSSNVDGAEYWDMRFNTSDQIYIQNRVGSSNLLLANTTAVYRDPSAWYHIVFVFDSNNATAANRNLLYVNGVNVTLSANSGSSDASAWNVNSVQHNIGVSRTLNPSGGIWAEYDGYEAEINMVDGQALTPSYFGQTSAITGVWEPIKYTGTYGTNGFYLSLSDTSSIGKDFSGNGNNWTPNNISTANDSTFDLMRDVPTQYTPQGATDVGGTVRGSYATLNPLRPFGGSLSNGNLTGVTGNSGSANGGYVTSTIWLPTSGKFYFEATPTTVSEIAIGLTTDSNIRAAVYYRDGDIYINGSVTTSQASYTNNDVIGVAVDIGGATVQFYKNNAAQGTAQSISAITSPLVACLAQLSGSGSATAEVNFGQRPFTYTPPSGFKSLCTTNLPTPTIGATAANAANKYFDATLYTGTGATLSVTNAGGFQPDFVWLKSRSATTNHHLYDAVRGTTKVVVGNTTESESTSANTITSFNSGGFTVGTNTAINTSAATYVGWQWWAGGSTVTNTSGSISSQVRASTTAGFSVVTYIGNGTGGATIGHGLGAAPGMLMFKNRDETGGNSILVWHSSFTNQEQMLLSSTAAIYNPGNGLYFNSTTPGASVVTLGTSGSTNPSAVNMLMYAWTPIAGFSSFGKYTGNASTDGPFIFTGFRPRFLLTKRSDAVESWRIGDSARSPYNGVELELFANLSNVEEDNDNPIDYLSNGFKIRTSSSSHNASGGTYIYMVFAETPFKNSLAR